MDTPNATRCANDQNPAGAPRAGRCDAPAPLPQVARITGGLVLAGARGGFAHADVLVDGETFAQVARLEEAGVATDAAGAGLLAAPASSGSAGTSDLDGVPDTTGVPGAVEVDARGCYVVPGLVDVHFHGCMGADFCDGTPEALHAIASYEASRGVTAVCPASMTFPADVLERAFSNAAAFEAGPREAALVGINMEGPYISPRKVGAQNPSYVRAASVEEFDALQAAAGGLVKIVDVAPEEPGNLDFVEGVAGRVRVSVAHTCAGYDEAAEAFERGARHMTHLFNAMPGLHHREPGPIAAAAERDDVTAELICDGIHVHPAMARLALELFGDERLVLISDTMRACGLDDGVYDLGGQQVHVRGPRATLADGTLAGSVTDLLGCVRCAVQQMEMPLETAVRCASLNPARAIGVDGQRGSIEAGKLADAVVLDQDLLPVHVVLRGRLLY